MKTYRLKCFMEGGNKEDPVNGNKEDPVEEIKPGVWGKSIPERPEQPVRSVQQPVLSGFSDTTNMTQEQNDETEMTQEQKDELWITAFMENVKKITDNIPIEKEGKDGWAFGYTTSVMIYLCEVILQKGNVKEEINPSQRHDLFVRAKKALGVKDVPNTFNIVVSSKHINICDDIFIEKMNGVLGCPDIGGTLSITFVHEVPEYMTNYDGNTIPIQPISEIYGHVKNMETINNIHNKLNKCNVT